ncbi:hypothetical protein ACOTTU_04100 [Roseobacter sp. EG26]|nr:hypothetical protein [uncultured Roseobacter sp.]
MTNGIAFVLGLTIVVLISADIFFYGTEHVVFLGKKMFELTEWLAFWR